MNTCKTCKHWDGPSPDTVRAEFVGMGDCQHPKLLGGTIDECRDGLFAGEVLIAPSRPCTGPDFGCVHWEAKP